MGICIRFLFLSISYFCFGYKAKASAHCNFFYAQIRNKKNTKIQALQSNHFSKGDFLTQISRRSLLTGSFFFLFC
ncbi:hypothetical protein V6Z11_A05G417600 [Gossypium hirsutum]